MEEDMAHLKEIRNRWLPLNKQGLTALKDLVGGDRKDFSVSTFIGEGRQNRLDITLTLNRMHRADFEGKIVLDFYGNLTCELGEFECLVTVTRTGQAGNSLVIEDDKATLFFSVGEDDNSSFEESNSPFTAVTITRRKNSVITVSDGDGVGC